MKMTTIFSADALLYYILEIYDCSQPLCHEMETKIYSRDEIKEIIYSVCNAVKFCHSMNIYHNNISIYNIYAKDNVYRLGRISTNKKLYSNSTDSHQLPKYAQARARFLVSMLSVMATRHRQHLHRSMLSIML